MTQLYEARHRADCAPTESWEALQEHLYRELDGGELGRAPLPVDVGHLRLLDFSVQVPKMLTFSIEEDAAALAQFAAEQAATYGGPSAWLEIAVEEHARK